MTENKSIAPRGGGGSRRSSSESRPSSRHLPPLLLYFVLVIVVAVVVVVVVVGRGRANSGGVAFVVVDNLVDRHNVPARMLSGEGEYVLKSNPRLYEATTTIDDEGGEGNGATTTVVGVLFNVRTRSDIPIDSNIVLTGFEFHTSLGGTVFYQLFSRDGSYYDPEPWPDGIDGTTTTTTTTSTSTMGSGGGPLGLEYWDVTSSNGLIAEGIVEDHVPCAVVDGGNTRSIADHRRDGVIREGADGDDATTSSSSSSAATCPLIAVPEEYFVGQWTLRGRDSTRSFYLTVASMDIYVALSSSPPNDGVSPPSFDTTIVASTPHLDLYEGLGTKTYPLHPTEGGYYLDRPVGFVGRIHYRFELAGDEEWEGPAAEEVEVEVEEEEEEEPAAEEEEEEPAAEEEEQEDELGNFSVLSVPDVASSVAGLPDVTSPPATSPSPYVAGDPSPSQPSPYVAGDPSPSPTPGVTRLLCRPDRPCVPLPATAPSPGDEDGAVAAAAGPSFETVELVLYMANVPERVMDDREREEYIDRVLGFLKENEDLNRNDVQVLGLTIFHQNVYKVRGNKKKKKRRSGGAEDEEGREGGDAGRGHQASAGGSGGAVVAEVENQMRKENFNATYPTVFVMTKVEVLTRLPREVAAFFVAEELGVHEAELIESFNGNAVFVSYFRDLNDIFVEVVDGGLSVPPTEAPTIFLEEEEEEEEDAAESRKLYKTIGIAIGVVWLLLSLYAWHAIHRYRKAEKERLKVTRSFAKKTRSSLLADEERKRAKSEHSRHLSSTGRNTSIARESISDRDVASRSSEGGTPSSGETGNTPKRRTRKPPSVV